VLIKPFTNRNRPLIRRVGWLVPIGFTLGGLLLLSPALGKMRSPSSATIGAACTSDYDCSDGVFCNGIERCNGASPGYCVAGTPPCSAGQRCDEDRDICETSCVDPDHDGDGHRAVRCGGDDCDDRDPNRYPGRQEVCDSEGHDEDCDPMTFGHRDHDGDGEDDIRCVNREANGTLHRGTDYDDNNAAVRVGSMICDGPDKVVVSGFSSIKCPDGTNCVAQPNGTGICIVPPANYQVPERFIPPPPPEQREALPGLSTLLSSADNTAPTRPAVPVLTGKERAADNPVTVAQPVATKGTDSPNDNQGEVAACKSILQSGKISWGGGTNWAAENIDKLCNGTRNAQSTIACFEKNVEALGWSAAIDKCR
jgi:hypothetical protein